MLGKVTSHALLWMALMAASASAAVVKSGMVTGMPLQRDTVVTLGRIERDLTGDGSHEILRIVGEGQSIDSLNVTLSIESSGRVIFQTALAPMTRTVGFDAGRRRLTSSEHRARVKDYARWFFDHRKFKKPSEFVAWLRGSAPLHIPRIPGVIARDRGAQLIIDSLVAAGDTHRDAERRVHALPARFAIAADTARAIGTWDEIQKAEVTLFEFSSGGDSITAIAWSARDQRFYRLLECC